MSFMFATCERRMALGFLKKLYPSSVIKDTPESAGPLLDYVERDIVRIPDPACHGPRVGLIPATNWNESLRDEVYAVAKTFHESVTAAKEPS